MGKQSLKGFSGLVLFLVTANNSSTYTVGTKIPVSGAQSFTRDPQKSEWKVFADDGIYDSGSDWQGDKVTITLAELPLDLKKNFEGGDYNATSKVYTFKSTSQAPEIALGFKCLLSDGTWLMKKFYSFKATSLKDEHKTKGEGNDITPYTIEGLIMNKVMDQTVKDEKIALTSADFTWLDTIS